VAGSVMHVKCIHDLCTLLGNIYYIIKTTNKERFRFNLSKRSKPNDLDLILEAKRNLIH
jgi:hypothetical protein